MLQVSEDHRGRIQLEFVEYKEPDFREVMRTKSKLELRYVPGYQVAKELGLSSHILSRITGSILVSKSPKEADSDRQSRINIGLNLKVYLFS